MGQSRRRPCQALSTSLRSRTYTWLPQVDGRLDADLDAAESFAVLLRRTEQALQVVVGGGWVSQQFCPAPHDRRELRVRALQNAS